MAAIKEVVSRDKVYHVAAVEKIDTPVGVEGGDWYRYVIALENETIVGNRRGTREQVTLHANECAESLSARSIRGTSTWSSRNKK